MLKMAWLSPLRLRLSEHLRRSWSVLYWFPTAFFLWDHFYDIKTVSGRSMQPTLNPDSSPSRDVALFSRFAVHTLRDYGRDDIVTLRSPEDPQRILIKRILAIEGDTVQTLPPYPDKVVTVPEGHVWVEGDEHFVSDDSNRFGPISAGLIESKLITLLWPLNRFGPMKKPGLLESELRDRSTLDAIKREQARHSRVQKSDSVYLD